MSIPQKAIFKDQFRKKHFYIICGDHQTAIDTTHWPQLAPNLFAIGYSHDANTNQPLHFARECAGDPDIYFCQQDETIMVSSDLEWLLKTTQAEIEYSLLPWLIMLGQLPAPLTIYRHISALPVGRSLSLDYQKKRLILNELDQQEEPSTPALAPKELHSLLTSAFRDELKKTKAKERALASSGGLGAAYLASLWPGRSHGQSYTLSVSGTGPIFDHEAAVNCLRSYFDNFNFDLVKLDLTGLEELIKASPLPPITVESTINLLLAKTAANHGHTQLFSGLGAAELWGRTPLQLFLAQLASGRSFKEFANQWPKTPWLNMGADLVAKKQPWLLPATIITTPKQLISVCPKNIMGDPTLAPLFNQPLRFLGLGKDEKASLSLLWKILSSWELDGRHQLARECCQTQGVTLRTPFLTSAMLAPISRYPWKDRIKRGIPGQLFSSVATGHVPDQLLKKRHLYPTLPLAAMVQNPAFANLADKALSAKLWEKDLFLRDKYLTLLAGKKEYRLLWALTVLAIWLDR